MNHLVPCPECSRHVRVTETECPFCALPLDLASTPEPRLPQSRLGRAATFAFGATLASATVLAACGGEAETTGTGGITVAPPYGVSPPPPAAAGSGGAGSGGAGSGGASDGGGGSGGIGVLYGGGPVPMYGGSPVPEPDEGGAAGATFNGGALYGGPPK
jgi:hypothetical protein